MASNIVQLRPEMIAARYSLSLGGSLGPGFNTIGYDTQDYDPYALSTGPIYASFTIPQAGKYLINASAIVTATFGAGAGTILQIVRNGMSASVAAVNSGASIGAQAIFFSDILEFEAGDTFEMQISSNAGSPALNNCPYLSIARLGT